MISVSIVIPVYHIEEYIIRCLDSLTGFDTAVLEVLIIDDCGKDSSISLAQEWIMKHPKIDARIIRHEHNKGLSGARNTGLRNAKGEYVYFLDGDDTIIAKGFRNMVKFANDWSVDFIIGGYQIEGSEKPYPPLKLNDGVYKGVEILDSYARGDWYMMAWNKLCKRKFLLDHDLWFEEGLIHEDVVWSFKLACEAQSMGAVNEPAYTYYIREGSIMTDTAIQKDLNAYMQAYGILTEYAKSKKMLNKATYEIIEGRKSTLLFSLLRLEEEGLYETAYRRLRENTLTNPISGLVTGKTGLKSLIRDFHYCLPKSLGLKYKRSFYNHVYGNGRKELTGALF